MNYVQKAVQSGAGMFEFLRTLKTSTLSLTRASNWGVGESGAACLYIAVQFLLQNNWVCHLWVVRSFENSATISDSIFKFWEGEGCVRVECSTSALIRLTSSQLAKKLVMVNWTMRCFGQWKSWSRNKLESQWSFAAIAS
jgi:hypothetical protein